MRMHADTCLCVHIRAYTCVAGYMHAFACICARVLAVVEAPLGTERCVFAIGLASRAQIRPLEILGDLSGASGDVFLLFFHQPWVAFQNRKAQFLDQISAPPPTSATLKVVVPFFELRGLESLGVSRMPGSPLRLLGLLCRLPLEVVRQRSPRFQRGRCLGPPLGTLVPRCARFEPQPPATQQRTSFLSILKKKIKICLAFCR